MLGRVSVWRLTPVVAIGTALLGGATALRCQAGAPSPSGAAEAANPHVIPAGTTIPLQLKNTISSRTAYVGENIYCETIYPIAVNNRILIPVGSYVKGSITQAARPGKVKGRAQLGLKFDSITLPDGLTRPLRATLSSYAGNGNEGFRRDEGRIEGASSKGKDAGNIAATAAEGATIGSLAGLSSRHTGTGAAIGGGAGALGGLIYVLATRGKEINLPPGTNLELEVLAPLDLTPGDEAPPSSASGAPSTPH